MKVIDGLISNSAILSARTIALAGLIFLSSQSALADDRMTFREFREKNEGIDRNAARQMFRQQFGRHAGGNAVGGLSVINPVQHVVTVGPSGEVVCGGGRIEGMKRTHESRVRNQSMQQLSTGNVTRVNRGVELDLGSTAKNIVLGRSLFGAGETVEVNIGGKLETFSSGSQVTAAEYVAVKQVLSGSGQQVQLDRSGRAAGGSVDLGSLTSNNDVMRASSLVVPRDVTTYGDFGRGSDFRLTGDLSNFGTVQTLSSDSAVRGGGIHADNITNHSGALIGANGDLQLNAASNLCNFGVIAATGNLSLSAGGKLVNTGTATANQDLNVTGNTVTNRGTLSSNSGNVGFATASGDLIVDNRRGTVSAVNGAINVREAAYAGSANADIVGGDMFSRELNLNSGLGSVNLNVNELTGVVNGTGSAAHVWADTSNLNIGSVCLTGDPTFFNRIGDINILDDITVAEDLTIVAAGSIFSADGVDIVAGDATQGYNITMIAGASFTASGTNSPTLGPITSPPYPNAGAVSITGKGSKTGGAIVLGDTNSLSSRSTDTASAGDRDGGTVSLFAFGKKVGFIGLDTTDIETGGVNLGANGDVFISAEGGIKKLAGPTIVTGNIDTTNQTLNPQGLAGRVEIATAKPLIAFGDTVTYAADGSRTSAALFTVGTSLTKTGGIAINFNGSSELLAADDVSIRSGSLMGIAGAVSGKAVDVHAGLGIFPGSGLVHGDSIVLSTDKKGLIGDPTSTVGVETSVLTVSTLGGKAAVTVLGTGVTDVTGVDGDELFVIAPDRDLQGSVTAKTQLVLVGSSIGFDPGVTAGAAITLVSTNAPLLNDGTNYIAPFVSLGAQNIGNSVADPFVLNSAVKSIDISSENAFVSSLAVKKPVGIVGADVTNLDFRANVGIAIVGNVSAAGTVNFQTTGGSMFVDDGIQVSAADGISLTNSGTTSKDKLFLGVGSILGTSSTLVGGGNINIRLGNAGGGAAPTPPNLNVTGAVQILGLGLTAKGSQSNITGNGATVTIENSVGAKNLVLEGDVNVFAAAN
jgi:filamentous hemagglutinin